MVLPLPIDELRRRRDVYEQHDRNATRAARALGIARSSLSEALNALEHRERDNAGTTQRSREDAKTGAAWKETRHRDEWVIEFQDDRIRNVDDAIKKAGVDMALWRVHEVRVNGWDVTMKIRSPGEPDAPFRSQNQQVRVTLRRTIPKTLAETVEPIMARVRKSSPKPPKRGRFRVPSDPHLLELGLYDAHLGKLAWAQETGTDYNLKTAKQYYVDAGHDLLNQCANRNLERIDLVIGNDFMHFCNEEGTTEKSRHILDVDGRLPKISACATEALTEVTLMALQVAPVKLTWVGGNHDMTASMWLTMCLANRFHADKHVTVDLRPLTHKAELYGCTLLARHHGDKLKPQHLPSIVMSENRALMPKAEHIEIRCGHWHQSRETEYLKTETFPGDVVARVLPSLSGRDAWHYRHGYGKRQAAEGHLLSKQWGYAGFFNTHPKRAARP